MKDVNRFNFVKVFRGIPRTQNNNTSVSTQFVTTELKKALRKIYNSFIYGSKSKQRLEYDIVILKARTETNHTFSPKLINNYTITLTLENNLFPSSYFQSKCMKINNASKQNHTPELIPSPKSMFLTHDRHYSTRHYSNEEETVSILTENPTKKKFGDAKSLAPNNLKLKRIQFILCFWIISLSNKS